MASVSASLSCPLCAHNPKRYELVEENCKTVLGFNTIQNVIQHLIKCHLNICRRCKQGFRPENPPKSRVKYKQMLDECPEHKTCAKYEWSVEEELKLPEILNEEQEKVVLSWTQNEATRRLPRGDPGASTRDSELWVDLYRQLYRKCPKTPDPNFKYWVANHKAEDDQFKLKRKLDDMKKQEAETQKRMAEMQRQLVKAQQQLRDQNIQGVWNPSSAVPAMTPEDREMLYLSPRALSEIGMAYNPNAAMGTIDPNLLLQRQSPSSRDNIDNHVKSNYEQEAEEASPFWGSYPDSGFVSRSSGGLLESDEDA